MKLIKSRLFRVIFLLFCLMVSFGIIRSVITIWQKRGIVFQRRAVLEAEEAKHARLKEQLREATSSAFIERAAREKLGLVKEGESVVILDKSKLGNFSSENSAQGQIPSWKQWWQLFF